MSGVMLEGGNANALQCRAQSPPPAAGREEEVQVHHLISAEEL